MNMKIRLTVVIGLLAAIILALLVSVLTIRARDQLLESAMRDVEQTALSVADQVARWEEIVVTTSEAVSMNPRVRAMDPNGHATAFAGALPALDRYVYTMYSIGPDGNQFILNNGEQGSGYRGDRSYFIEAMEEGRVASQVLMGRSLDPPAPAVAYGIPIFAPGQESRAAGVLLVASTLSEVSRIVQNNVGEAVANAYVVDSEDRLVAHSSASLLEGDELVDYSNHPPVSDNVSERSEKVYRYQDEGRTMVSRNVEIGNGWTVFVEAEEASVMAAAAAFTTIGTVMSIAGLLLLLIVLWSVISFNLKPLTLLADRFEAYARGGGDLTTRIAIKRNDEIGQVATHFNSFVGVLNTLVSSVKATVTEAIEQKETVSASTTEVASSADEISATVQSIRSRLQQLSDEAAESSAAADRNLST